MGSRIDDAVDLGLRAVVSRMGLYVQYIPTVTKGREGVRDLSITLGFVPQHVF